MPNPTYSLISSTTLTSTASVIDFTSIPQGYYDLRFHYSIRVTGAVSGADIKVTINNLSNVYRSVIMYADSTTNIRGYGVGNASSNYADAIWAAGGNIPGANSLANVFSNGTMLIPGYRNTTNLSRRGFGTDTVTVTDNAANWAVISGAQTSNPAAVNRVTFTLDAGYGSLAIGSTISLYGCNNS
jgi:hypothetical protein